MSKSPPTEPYASHKGCATGHPDRKNPYRANDALLAKAHAEVNDNRRIARYRDVNRHLTKQASHVPVVNDLAPLAMKPTVKGFVHTPLEWYSFATIWKES